MSRNKMEWNGTERIERNNMFGYEFGHFVIDLIVIISYSNLV